MDSNYSGDCNHQSRRRTEPAWQQHRFPHGAVVGRYEEGRAARLRQRPWRHRP